MSQAGSQLLELVPVGTPPLKLNTVALRCMCPQGLTYIGHISVGAAVAPPSNEEVRHATGRNAAQRRFHPTRKSSTGWFKVPPAVPLSPVVP